MYFSKYERMINELERKQRERPKRAAYKDADGNTHPASILKMLYFEVNSQLHGEPSPIADYKISPEAGADNPILTSLFELSFKHNHKKSIESR